MAAGTSGDGLISVRVATRKRQTDSIISLEFSPVERETLPPFEPGAHVDVHLAPGLVRQYSLCNDPSEVHRYCIGVLREPQSRGGSIAIHDRFHVGTQWKISPPRNNFRLDARASRTILLAGGIGLTPLLSMARHLDAIGAPFDLHYCCRSRASAAFREELVESSFASRVSFHFDDGPASQSLAIEKVLSSYSAGDHAYVCGPAGFMNYVTNAAKGLAWSDDAIHVEYFNADVNTSGSEFTVYARRSNVRATVRPNQTIVEALHIHGIVVPVSCEQGVCGTCMTRVLDGIPDHRDLYQTDAEKAANTQMTLCCSRAQSPVLVLDI